MNIYCPKCGEPIKEKSLRGISGTSYKVALRQFMKHGHPGIGLKCNEALNEFVAALADAIYGQLNYEADQLAEVLRACKEMRDA